MFFTIKKFIIIILIPNLDELQSMLNALALKNSLTQNVVSLGNGSTMSSQVNNAKSFDKNKQPSGLMDFPFCVPKMPSRMESDPVKPNSNTSSDMNPNLASLLYTHLPYFQGKLKTYLSLEKSIGKISAL